mgnify:CR=1 FL=1
MKYSELEKMDHMEALLMLYRKIREVRPTADASVVVVVSGSGMMDQENGNCFCWRSWQKPLRCR